MRWGKGLLRALLLGLAFVVTAGADSLPEVIARITPSVVGMGTFMATRQPRVAIRGTGFAVADGRHVITNHHVVADPVDKRHAEHLAVLVPRGRHEPRALAARVVACDRTHDLCLLRFKGKLPPLTLGHAAAVREGEAVALTGFPIGMVLGLHAATHRGIVAAITPLAMPSISGQGLTADKLRALSSPFAVFQLDIVAYPGNSGSPLYLRGDGKVIGVVNSVFVKGSKEDALSRPSGISYAIPATYVYDLLMRNGLKP